MLTLHQKAPTFSLPNQDNTPVDLSGFRDRQNIVLYFYPKDDTPGCTIEANQFTELVEDFAAADTTVIGVSKDTCDSHSQFINKYGLKINLLADTHGKVCEDYGVWQEKEKDGNKKMGIVRSTFLIDKQGNLQDVIYEVNPEGHAAVMLEKARLL